MGKIEVFKNDKLGNILSWFLKRLISLVFCFRISSLHSDCDSLRRRLEESTEKLRKQEESALRSEVG